MSDKLDTIKASGLLSEDQARRFMSHMLDTSVSLRAEEDFILSVRNEILTWYQRPFARWLVRPEMCHLLKMRSFDGPLRFGGAKP